MATQWMPHPVYVPLCVPRASSGRAKLSPTNIPARRALMRSLLALGEKASARSHLPIYEALGAKDGAEVREWFTR